MYYAISQIQSAAHKNTLAKWQERKRSSKSLPSRLNGTSPTGSRAWIAIVRAVCRSLDSHNNPWICWSSSGSGEARLKREAAPSLRPVCKRSDTFLKHIQPEGWIQVNISKSFWAHSASERTKRNKWWKTERIASVWLSIDGERIAILSSFPLSFEVQMN